MLKKYKRKPKEVLRIKSPIGGDFVVELSDKLYTVWWGGSGIGNYKTLDLAYKQISNRFESRKAERLKELNKELKTLTNFEIPINS